MHSLVPARCHHHLHPYYLHTARALRTTTPAHRTPAPLPSNAPPQTHGRPVALTHPFTHTRLQGGITTRAKANLSPTVLHRWWSRRHASNADALSLHQLVVAA